MSGRLLGFLLAHERDRGDISNTPVGSHHVDFLIIGQNLLRSAEPEVMPPAPMSNSPHKSRVSATRYRDAGNIRVSRKDRANTTGFEMGEGTFKQL